MRDVATSDGLLSGGGALASNTLGKMSRTWCRAMTRHAASCSKVLGKSPQGYMILFMEESCVYLSFSFKTMGFYEAK